MRRLLTVLACAWAVTACDSAHHASPSRADERAAAAVVTRYVGLMQQLPDSAHDACALLTPTAQDQLADAMPSLVGAPVTALFVDYRRRGLTRCEAAMRAFPAFGATDRAASFITTRALARPSIAETSSDGRRVHVRVVGGTRDVTLTRTDGTWHITDLTFPVTIKRAQSTRSSVFDPKRHCVRMSAKDADEFGLQRC